MAKRAKILFTIGTLGYGGKERQLTELIYNLPSEKFEIYLLTKKIDSEYVNKIESKVFRIYNLRLIKLNLKTLFTVCRIINEVDPAIIHSWTKEFSIFAIIAKFLYFKKLKIIEGSIRDAQVLKKGSFSWIQYSFIFRFSNYIVGNSYTGLKNYLAPKSKSTCIYNGFDFQRIENIRDKEFIRNAFKIETKYMIGMVATISPFKDYEAFIKAAQLLLETRDDVTFLAIGYNFNNNLEHLKSFILEKHQNRIVFTGKQNDVESLINLMDVGVLLTNMNTHQEGISNAIMEYFALGKPVIATKCESNSEIIIDGENGFMIVKNEINSIVEKMNYLLNNSEDAFRFGMNGKLTIQKQFGIDTMVDKYESLYSKLL